MNDLEQYYKILGLKLGASEQEIVQAYKTIIKKVYPGNLPNDDDMQRLAREKLKDIDKAFKTLLASTTSYDVLQKQEVTAKLRVKSDPPDAKVYVNGKEVGKSPVAFTRVPPGQYLVRVGKEGYEPYEIKVQIGAGELKEVSIPLNKSLSLDKSLFPDESSSKPPQHEDLRQHAKSSFKAQTQTVRPEKVGTSVKLLYITLGIGVLRSIMEASTNAQMASPAFVTFITLFVLGIMWLFIYLIGKGLNWARITFLVLFIIGIPLAVLPLLASLEANPVSGLLGIGQLIIQTIALVFLFQKSSSEWFREMKAEKRPDEKSAADYVPGRTLREYRR